MFINKSETLMLYFLIIMSTLDLSKLTFLNAPSNHDLMKLIISGLLQMHNAKIDTGTGLEWINFTKDLKSLTKEYEKLPNKDQDDPIVVKYRNVTNLKYIVELGKESTFRFNNEEVGINTSSHYKKLETIQSMIEHYNSLSDKDKKQLAKDLNDKSKNQNNVLPKFLGRILQGLYYAYPLDSKNKIIMLKDVSALLVLTRNTLNYIKSYGQ